MAKKELRKLNRAELLELLVAQTERADRLSEELHEAKSQVRDREELISQANKLAEAASKLTSLLESEAAGEVYMQPTQRQPLQTKQAASGATWADAVKAVSAENKGSGKSAQVIPKQAEDTKHETNGIDVSAIIAITSGIGKGKI